jgi:N-acyl-D-amino-acid deacylase
LRETTRRRFLRDGGRGFLGLALFPRIEWQPAFDLVLKGGTVVDGTGGTPFPADVGVRGDAIEAVGAIPEDAARRVVDVSGLHVAPGFVDIHSHSDGDILAYPGAESRAMQGVTTEITGNCGSSAAPLAGEDLARRRADLEEEGVRPEWSDLASYCAVIERSAIAVNHAMLLGQGTLRRGAVGLVNRPLTHEELDAVLRAVEGGMDQGAFGLSTGLEYVPGRYTPTDEIVAMARVVGRRGGLYASHIRNEEASLLEAVGEAIEIGRRSGARVEISHLKAAGRRNWPKQRAALHLVESARRDGVEVLADAYPYTAYSTGLTIFLDDAALEGGTPAMLERLRDPAQRSRIRGQAAERIAADPGDFDLVVISRVKTEANRAFVGKSLAQIAALRGLEPVDALLALLEEEEGIVSFIGHGMSEENVEQVLAHPLVMIGSDGASMAPTGRAALSRPHPRSYGAFARVLGRFCRERRLFDLPTAVKKMTSLPADQVGLPDRGRIARGKKADLVAFDAATVKDEATFDDPHRYPAGIAHVLVNGVFVVESGRHTGARPGRVLRRS